MSYSGFVYFYPSILLYRYKYIHPLILSFTWPSLHSSTHPSIHHSMYPFILHQCNQCIFLPHLHAPTLPVGQGSIFPSLLSRHNFCCFPPIMHQFLSWVLKCHKQNPVPTFPVLLSILLLLFLISPGFCLPLRKWINITSVPQRLVTLQRHSSQKFYFSFSTLHIEAIGLYCLSQLPSLAFDFSPSSLDAVQNTPGSWAYEKPRKKVVCLDSKL